MNGLAVHQELGNEQFIGAVYSEVLTDNAEALADSGTAMRMELKIVSSTGLTSRRFSRMWIEGMAINNPSNQLTAQADNMVKFDGLFKGRLETNDHIVFAQKPGQGLNVLVNNILLGNIADDQFFPMLLRTWIGKVPLSSTYRDNLLKAGDVDSSLRSRFDSIQPSPARVAAVKEWTKPAEAPKAAEATAAVAAAATTAKVAAKPEAAKTAPKIAAPKVDLPQLSTTTESKPSSEPSPSQKVAENKEPKQAPKPESKPASTQPAAEEEEDNEPALTAQSLLARQFYVSDLLKVIRTNVRYPRRAADRNQEGGVRIAITIDRQGKIKNMAWLEESRYDLLNKEAWESIARAAPFPAMPEAIPGREFEFSAPITFALPKN